MRWCAPEPAHPGAQERAGAVAVASRGGDARRPITEQTRFPSRRDVILIAAATASPMTRAVIITATAAGGPQVNFSAPTGKTLNKSMFGFSCSYWGGQHFTDATFRATANTYLKPACLIFNPDWDLDGKYAAGDMTVINQLLGNYRSFCQSGVRVVMGCCYKPTLPASTMASRAANFARWLNSNGYSDILDWRIGSMWDSDPGSSMSQVVSYFNAVSDALHAVNPRCRVWAAPQWDPGVYGNASFASQVGSTRCNSMAWMTYDCAAEAPDGSLTDPLDIIYGAKGVSNQDAVTQRNALAGTSLANTPLGVAEWNMGEATVGGGTTIPQNGRYMSGIYAACLTYGLFKSVPNMDFACLQNIVAYGYEGAIGNTQQGGRMAAVCAHGYFLGKAGQSLYGPEYTATNNIANLAILAVKPSSTTFAILLINYDLSNARTINLSLSGGVPSGTISRWEIGKSSPGAPNSPTPATGAQAGLESISVASETIVILTGQLS